MTVRLPPTAVLASSRGRSFARAVLSLRAVAVPTSWYRTPADNRRVGGCEARGVPRALCRGPSRHLTGLALDVVPARGVTWSRLASAARAAGLRVLDERTHLHLE